MDSNKLEELIHCYSNYVETIIRNMSKNILTNEDIEEIISDVFFNIWKKKDDIKSNSEKYYIAEVTRNLVKNKFRNVKFEENIESHEDLSDKYEIEDIIESDNRIKVVDDTLNNINEIDRNVFMYYYYNNMSIKEISQITKISEISLKVKLHRTRNKIRNNLKRKGYSYGR